MMQKNCYLPIKDTYREKKAPSNKTPVLTKIWAFWQLVNQINSL